MLSTEDCDVLGFWDLGIGDGTCQFGFLKTVQFVFLFLGIRDLGLNSDFRLGMSIWRGTFRIHWLFPNVRKFITFKLELYLL